MLKVGCANKKEQYLDIIVGAIHFVIALAIMLLLLFLTEIKPIYDCGIALAYFLIAFIVTINIATSNGKISRMGKKFYKTCNYEKFLSEIEKIKKNDLNPETLTYVMILKTNIEYTIDFSLGVNSYNRLKRPKIRAYSTSYNLLTCITYINKKEYDKAYNLAKKYNGEKGLSNADVVYIKLLVDVYNGVIIPNIEKMLPTEKGLLFTRIYNADILAKYYKDKDKEKAKKYAQFILDTNTCFEELNKNAKSIIE